MNQKFPFKKIHTVMALALFIVGAFFGIFTLQAAQPLPFGSALTGMFPGIETNYSSIAFQYGGNNFAGMFFWTSGTNLSTPETVTVSGGSQSISCNQRINGIYYNNQRGRKIWPLDTGNLQILINSGSAEYGVLQITGGLYTNCTALSGGYTPTSNEVYGQVTHTRSGTIFQLVAGLNYNFTGNSITGNSFGGTLQGINNIASGYIYDSYGGIGYVGSTGQGTFRLSGRTGICLAFDMSPPTPLVLGNTTTFTCYGNTATGNSITGYILTVYSGGSPIYSNLVATGASQYSETTTGGGLSPGSYSATCVILGVGNGAGSSCNNQAINFTVVTGQVSTGISCGLQGNLTIISTSGNVTQASQFTPNYYYARTTGGINFQIWSTIPSLYTISSSGMSTTITGTYNYAYNPPLVTNINTGTINLSINNGQAQINTIFSTGSCSSYSVTNRITIDTTPPTAPTSLSPTSGNGICYVGSSLFSRSGAVDSGVGITQYNYKIYLATNLTTPIINANTTGTSVNINASSLGTGYFSGNYFWTVQAIDGLNQTGSALSGTFSVGLNYCTNSGNIIIHGTIPRLRNADLNKEYLSDPFTVDGLPGPIIAYLSTGVLYVNGTGKSNTGYINNGDELNIKLRSSTQYDTTVDAIFYVGPRYATYHITTKSLTGFTPTSGCVLDTGQKLIIQNIFDMMKDTYTADQGTLSDFLFTIQSMLQDDVDLTNNCSLEYLLNVVDSYIMDNIAGEVDESSHEAPNCKVYEITYDDVKQGYTSPNLKKKTYFATRNALTRYIDSKNPGDCRINTYEDLPDFDSTSQTGYYIAPNGKMYRIKEKTGSGGTILHYSPDFLKAKNFENQDDLFRFIDVNNPVNEVRDHEVDTDFDPLFYTAPNGKEYKIYKTDQGFMSYKLMKVQYFETLEDIKAYIDRNNRM